MLQAVLNWTSCRRPDWRLKSNFARKRNDGGRLRRERPARRRNANARPKRRPRAIPRSANRGTKGSVRALRSNVSPLPSERTHRHWDIAAFTLLVTVVVIVTALMIGDAAAFIRGDWPTMFLPLYAFLGERLRVFDVPGWNPYQFSGAAFAGDPSSGWGYLPAMIAFTVMPALSAITVFIGFHIALSAIAAYILARLTGLAPAGAFVAGAA